MRSKISPNRARGKTRPEQLRESVTKKNFKKHRFEICKKRALY